MPPLRETLEDYLAAGFAGIWLQTQEVESAVKTIAAICQSPNVDFGAGEPLPWSLYQWDKQQGFTSTTWDGDHAISQPHNDRQALARAIMLTFEQMKKERAQRLGVLILHNLHRFLAQGAGVDYCEVIQALANVIPQAEEHRLRIVAISPGAQIPPELEKLFVLLKHDLPDREQLKELMLRLGSDTASRQEISDEVLEAASGLTRQEAKNAFSLSLRLHGELRPDVVWDLKSQELKKSGLLQLHAGAERFADLGGLEAVKKFCLTSLKQGSRDPLTRPRGILLMGVPGTGKSAFAKALGNESGRRTIILNVGALMGSLIGQTEERTRRALDTIDAMEPCILFLDEVEKALGGVTGGGAHDGGVGARLFGQLLTWLNDHTSDVFFIGTCNQIQLLPPEFSRAERFDGIFFMDLPGREQKDQIWALYRKLFGVDGEQPEDADWTGAEIRSCCRLAKMLGVSLEEAAQNVVPVARTARETVDALRKWAEDRCLSAETGRIYHIKEVAGTNGSTRTIARRRASGSQLN